MTSSEQGQGPMRLRTGTSGFAYKPWKGPFYPPDLPDARMLGYYSSRFSSVEINNTFYRMPQPQVLAGWGAQVPADFSFALKASRRITHQGRLKVESVADAVGWLFDAASALGDKLGPVLFQLPPFQRIDVPRLAAFLELLPAGRRVAVEFRHRSWFDDAVYDVLRRHDAALCSADGEVEGAPALVATAGWGYLRLREEDYSDAALGEWCARIREQSWTEAFAFFKHEDAAGGPRLAVRMDEIFRGAA